MSQGCVSPRNTKPSGALTLQRGGVSLPMHCTNMRCCALSAARHRQGRWILNWDFVADWSEWVAPIATMIAAIMTAVNLGSRVTGWGFVVFLVGSIHWTLLGLATEQKSLLAANGFLCCKPLFAVLPP